MHSSIVDLSAPMQTTHISSSSPPHKLSSVYLTTHTMNPSSLPPDPRHLALPVDSLSPIPHALFDLAHTTPTTITQPAQRSIPTSTSTSHVAQRLALRLHDKSLPPTSLSSDVFTPPTPSTLAKETALVHALALWARSFLPEHRLQHLCSLLAHDIDSVLRAEMPVLPLLRPFDHLQDARRAALNAALRVRYGGLKAAPTAAMIAGAPFVLYVREGFQRGGRVEMGGDNWGDTDEDVKKWEGVCAGLAIVEEVEVEEVHLVRAVVGGKLKEAVKSRGLAPVLVVVRLMHDGGLAMGGDVLRAVCDGYGARLHVEGEGVGILLGGGEGGVLAVVGVAHSVLVDVGSWFGRFGVAVMLGVVGESDEGAWFGGVMALWFLLERLNLQKCRRLLEATCEMGRVLAEGLYSVPHLLEVTMVGCARHVLVSYAGVDADAEVRTLMNRAMFAYLERMHSQFRQLLVMGKHENREWLVFSPMRVLNAAVCAAPVTGRVMKAICRDLIRVARRCEVVVKGRAVFISQMRQCQDVEVESLTARRRSDPSAPLFFGALRVTPFGEVSRNGHWMKDEEMTVKVEKYTCALASILSELNGETFEALIQDSEYDKNEVSMIYVGPILVDASPSPRDEKVIDEIREVTDALALCKINAALAEEWDLGESAAQELALKAAERVTAVLSAALDAKEEDTEQGREDQEINRGDTDLIPEDETERRANGVEARGTYSEQSVESSVAHDSIVQTGGNFVAETEASEVAGKNTMDTDDTTEDEERILESRISNEDKPSKRGEASERKNKGGIWSLLFGEDPIEDEESTGSVGSPKGLEDDYFRP